MAEVAVFGGSFDPPHVGHAMVAGWLLWTERVEQVWLVPTYAHAFGKRLSPFARRVAMCRALARDLGGGVHVEAVEADLPVPSYTIQTLRELSRRHPGHALRLVVGADVLQQVDSWRDWDRVVAEYNPIFVGRHGFPPVEDSPLFPGVSSTEVRRRLASGEPVEHLVPAGVLRVLGR